MGDAITILSLQPPETSALYRVQFPEHFNRSMDTDRLESIAVMLRQLQQLLGNQSGVNTDDLAGTYEDLFEKTKLESTLGKRGGEFTLEEMDALMGWDPVALGWK